MTANGTGIAAGVAQTALQAQQVGRRRDRVSTEDAANAKRLRELLETHLRALEEGDEFESPAQLHIDGHLPEQSGQQGEYSHRKPHQSPSPQAQAIAQDAADPDADQQQADLESGPDKKPLYRHLDIHA